MLCSFSSHFHSEIIPWPFLTLILLKGTSGCFVERTSILCHVFWARVPQKQCFILSVWYLNMDIDDLVRIGEIHVAILVKWCPLVLHHVMVTIMVNYGNNYY